MPGVGLGSVVAVATGSGVRLGEGGGECVGASVAFSPAGNDAVAVGTAASAGGGAPQANASPNMAGKTMIEIARSKIALFMPTVLNVPVPPVR